MKNVTFSTGARGDSASSQLVHDAANAPRARRPYYGRYIAALIVVLLIVEVVILFSSSEIKWGVTAAYLFDDQIMAGVANVLLMTVLAMSLGGILGVTLALMALSGNPVLSVTAKLYVWIFRAVPEILQLLLWYNLALIIPSIQIPGLFEVETISIMTPLVAALLGLGLQEGAYSAEVFRAGFRSIGQGQTDAAKAIGMNGLSAFRRIILPQAMRTIVPPISNRVINMVKMTSLASVIQYHELLFAAQQIYLTNTRVMELLMVAAFWYVAIVTILSIGQSRLENKFGRGFSPPPAPLTSLFRKLGGKR